MNRSKVFSIIWSSLKSIVPIGFFIWAAIYVGGIVIEILYAICLICTCSSNHNDAIPFLWSWDMFYSLFVFFTFGAFLIALVKGFLQAKSAINLEMEKQRNDQTEQAIAQRRNWAAEARRSTQTLLQVINHTIQNADIKLSQEYLTSSASEEAGRELTEIAVILGQLDAVADEINGNGGNA